MPERPPLIVHERIGLWARQFRPRAAAWRRRMIESRSAEDLVAAVAGSPFPVLIVDLADRPMAGLDALDRAIERAPTTLALVLDPADRDGVPPLARELGASLVLSGQATPPEVVGVVERWLGIADARAVADGWIGGRAGDDDDGDEIDQLIRAATGRPATA